MLVSARTENAVAITSTSTMSEDTGGPISKVLVLNGDANSALAALLSDLETIFDHPNVFLAGNQREALLGLRKATYGY